MYCLHYVAPEGFSDLEMQSDGEVLTRLVFLRTDEKHRPLSEREKRISLPVFCETVQYLDLYFSGAIPDFLPRFRLEGATPFRKAVSELLLKIPYGETVTYGDLAKELARLTGKKKISAQAVGGAVGWNPLCILIPCHRVIGAKGDLVGYGGGIENKRRLLALEASRGRIGT